MEEIAGPDWTLYIALYGALLASAVAAYDGFLEWRARRPNIKVEVSTGHLYWSAYPSGPMLFLSASNAGEKAVTLNSMGFILPDKNRLLPVNMESNVRFPHELRPETECKAWIGADEMAFMLKASPFSGKVKLIGCYGDVVGRTHKSKPFEFDVEESCA